MTLKEAIKEAFFAGFNSSSEGCNGEYGANENIIEEKFEEWFEEEVDL